MIWFIATYLLVGVAFFAWQICSDLPYQVQVGDIFAIILGLPVWPLIAIVLIPRSDWLAYPLFVIGKDEEDE